MGLTEGTWGDVIVKEIEDPADGCMDLASSGVLIDYPFAPMKLKCSDMDNDGKLDFDLGIVWSVNNGASQCSMTGGVANLPKASPNSKCWYPKDGSTLINIPSKSDFFFVKKNFNYFAHPTTLSI